MSQDRESMIADALSRVLRAAYLDVEIGAEYRMNARTEQDVARDEHTLRQALFSPELLNCKCKKN